MTRFEELADAPTLERTTREASEAELPHDDGRLSTIDEESEADRESHVMEAWHAGLQEERGTAGGSTTRGPLYHAYTDGSRSKCADHFS
eukprot:4447210-Pyramimonas_sp.AAC.3